jgi:organic radical activating enzyme
VEGNVQWVRKDVNLMKQSYTVQQFTSVCAAVARHSGVEPNIAATQYSLQSKAFEVYISGCLGPHCTNCHNPELWDFSQGRAAAECIDEVQLKVMRAAEMIEQIWLLGGDPLDQSEVGLVLLLERLSSLKPVVLFTRKNIDEVPLRVKELCAYIKTGRYDETLKVEGHKEHGITLSTRNQQVHKMPKSKWNTRTIDKVALDRYLRQSDALYYD